jgi:hypothetical protein
VDGAVTADRPSKTSNGIHEIEISFPDAPLPFFLVPFEHE